jgi:XRE family transcriptional regulator, regulator of sulfur utilization
MAHSEADPADRAPDPRREGELNGILAQRLAGLLPGAAALDRLSRTSGLSRKSLGRIVGGEAVPTINVLWRIANALGVPFGSLIAARKRRGMTLLRPDRRQVMTSEDGRFTSRSLLPFDGERLVEFYELTIAPGHVQRSEAHAPGTIESLILVRGRVEIGAGREAPQTLEPGDALVFESDVPHFYRNLGDGDAALHLVMSYVDLIH